MKCLVCNVKVIISDDILHDGVWCSTMGTFGSAYYKPTPKYENKIEFIVCDECLEKNISKCKIHGEKPKRLSNKKNN